VALANDMMIFYAPAELCKDDGLTVMEIICASPCITSMICFSLEVKYGNLFNTKALMHRHRVGARGNATTFPLPWEVLLQELQKLDTTDGAHVPVQLPRTGADLLNVVQILLKTNDDNKSLSLRNFIHQATVRRHRVANLILEMKKLGHRAYMHVDDAAVRRKGSELPENGVPPELVHFLPNDNSLDKMQIQKAATPVEGRQKVDTPEDLEQARRSFKEQRPNAVVLERPSADAIDLNERLLHGLRAFTSKMDVSAAGVVQQDFLNIDTKVEARRVRNKKKFQSYLTNVTYFHTCQLLVPYIGKEEYRDFVCTANDYTRLQPLTSIDDVEWFIQRETLTELFKSSKAYLQQFIISSGCGMMNQFEPWYFVAFCILFQVLHRYA